MNWYIDIHQFEYKNWVTFRCDIHRGQHTYAGYTHSYTYVGDVHTQSSLVIFKTYCLRWSIANDGNPSTGLRSNIFNIHINYTQIIYVKVYWVHDVCELWTYLAHICCPLGNIVRWITNVIPPPNAIKSMLSAYVMYRLKARLFGRLWPWTIASAVQLTVNDPRKKRTSMRTHTHTYT